jgi:predicted dehydrogenase
MIKIAILGCDSSHTEAYTSLINKPGSPFYGQARVCWIWGENIDEARSKAKALDIECVLSDLDTYQLLDADLLMVIGRFGDSHSYPALKAIELGKPTFIDKPFTNSDSQANEIMELAFIRDVPIMSFSPLRFSEEIISINTKVNKLETAITLVATCPLLTNSIVDERATSIYFYSIHAVDVMLSIIDSRPKSVCAIKHAAGVWVTLRFENDTVSSVNLTVGKEEIYNVVLFEDGQIRSIDINPEGIFYQKTLEVLFEKLIKGDTASAPIHQAYDGIRILTAIGRSLELKQEIYLDEKI